MITLRDRMLGSCYGAIFGDIIGAYNEFQEGYMIRKVTMDMLRREDDIFGHPFGHFTDDTSCSLITMDAFTPQGPEMFDADYIMRELKDWRDNGAYSSTMQCFDIGRATDRAISGTPDTNEQTGNGNGALMRIYPVVLASHRLLSIPVVKYAKLTHPTEISSRCCVRFANVLLSILQGKQKGDPGFLMMNTLENDIYGYACRLDWSDNFVPMTPSMTPTGFVADTLYWALKVFFETDSYLEGVIRLAEMGDDSDTVCSIYGALAGAYYGIQGVQEIPEDLRNRLAKKQFVDDTVTRFVDAILK